MPANAGDTGSIPDQGCGATKAVHHNHWASALQPRSRKYWRPCTGGPMQQEKTVKRKCRPNSSKLEKKAHAAIKAQHNQNSKKEKSIEKVGLVDTEKIDPNWRSGWIRRRQRAGTTGWYGFKDRETSSCGQKKMFKFYYSEKKKKDLYRNLSERWHRWNTQNPKLWLTLTMYSSQPCSMRLS